jgi:hypothetical protein
MTHGTKVPVRFLTEALGTHPEATSPLHEAALR